LKATLKGQLFYQCNPNEVAKFIMEVLRISDFNGAKEIWRERDKQASEIAKIGRATEEVMLGLVVVQADTVDERLEQINRRGKQAHAEVLREGSNFGKNGHSG
jgi:hypothetical protein